MSEFPTYHPLEKLPLPLKGKSRALLTIYQQPKSGFPEIWEGVQMLQTIEVEIDAKGHILPPPSAPQQRTESINEDTSAYGVLTASRSVSLDEMETAIYTRGSRL